MPVARPGLLHVANASQITLRNRQHLFIRPVEVGAVHGAREIGEEHAVPVQIQRQADPSPRCIIRTCNSTGGIRG